jgi:hypothetical protein
MSFDLKVNIKFSINCLEEVTMKRRSKNKLFYLIKICWSIFLLNILNTTIYQNVNAEVYRATHIPVKGHPTVTATEDVNQVWSLYNTETQDFTFIIHFKKQTSVPNSFYTVLNSTGADPKGIAGELPIFFFDYTNINKPRLSAYVYNGESMGTSHIDSYKNIPGNQPDMIVSSATNSNFVKEFFLKDTGTELIRGFTIRGSIINNHKLPTGVPQSNWEGVGFKTKFGLWFHALRDTVWQYNSNQTINSFHYSRFTAIDFPYIPTDLEDPICNVAVHKNTVKVGEKFFSTFVGCDPNGDTLTPTVLGLNNKAKVSILPKVGNPPVGSDPNKNWLCTTVNIEYTAEQDVSGKNLSVDVEFKDEKGASTTCKCGFTVPVNKNPTCSPLASLTGQSCLGTTTLINLKAPLCTDDTTNVFSYKWSTTCPNGVFENSNIANTTFRFNSESSAGKPTVCTVSLVVSDGYLNSSFTTNVSVNSCNVDCKGVINGVAKIDQCGVCNGNGKTCLDCAGIPNGGKVIDKCGVCGGNNSTCKDCMGTPNGDKTIDHCGVCGGDNSTCKDCAGIPNGGKIVDQCGICGGDNSTCKDCSGETNGSKKIDLCGICGGDGTSCLDCAGEPHGHKKLDSCGICDGDNKSCISCAETNISVRMLELDSGLEEMYIYAKKLNRNINKIGGKNSKSAIKAKDLLSKVELAWIGGWQYINSLSPSVKTCISKKVCLSTSFLSNISAYKVASTDAVNSINEMAKIMKLLAKRNKLSSEKQRKLYRTLQKSANKRHQLNLIEADKLPIPTSFNCASN